MKEPTRRVAMFDSGLGGLTILTALQRRIPDADIIYAADTARVPYGDRTLEEVAGFARQIIAYLEQYAPSLLIIACGTSCSAFDALGQPQTSMLLLPVVDCGVRAALETSKRGRIGVVATAATIHSGVFERKIKRALPQASITSVSAPKLVPLVEAGAWRSEAARDAVEQCCAPFRGAACDTVVLGCTHFPHLEVWFRCALPADVALIDPALECARQAAVVLEPLKAGTGTITFEVSGSPDEFMSRAADLADVAGSQVRRVDFSDKVKQPEYR
jgi:glutamate racemase